MRGGQSRRMGKQKKLIERLTPDQAERIRRDLYELSVGCSDCISRKRRAVRLTERQPILDVVEEMLNYMGIDFTTEELPGFIEELNAVCRKCGRPWDSNSKIDMLSHEKVIGIGSVKEKEEIQTSRVQAVVMFADIRQFSEWVKEGQSPEMVGDFLRRCYLLFRKVLWQNENPFVKLLGDGFFACWEIEKTANSTSNLAERYKELALETAFEIVESYPSIEEDLGRPIASGLGIGIVEDFVTKLKINIGDKEQFDYVGYPVNLAAHIQSIACANQVLVHDHVRRRLNSSLYSFKGIPEEDLLELKGIYESERTRIFEVHKSDDRLIKEWNRLRR